MALTMSRKPSPQREAAGTCGSDEGGKLYSNLPPVALAGTSQRYG